jgi:hypothetical protein
MGLVDKLYYIFMTLGECHQWQIYTSTPDVEKIKKIKRYLPLFKIPRCVSTVVEIGGKSGKTA